MERGQSLTPGLAWLWSSFGRGAPGLAGAARHNLFITSQGCRDQAAKLYGENRGDAPDRACPGARDSRPLPILNQPAPRLHCSL
jgi:hypothetical protein